MKLKAFTSIIFISKFQIQFEQTEHQHGQMMKMVPDSCALRQDFLSENMNCPFHYSPYCIEEEKSAANFMSKNFQLIPDLHKIYMLSIIS